MAVNYIELFNLAYSTSISESVKEEIINNIKLPIFESEIEISENIYESIYFLDELAYSNMSEELVNSIIDDVFEGFSEEYLEEVYEAYVRAKTLMYISEGAAPIGLTGLRKEFNNVANEKPKKSLFKRIVGGAADKIKGAVDKVSRWANQPAQPSARAKEANQIRNDAIKDRKVASKNNEMGQQLDKAFSTSRGTTQSPTNNSQGSSKYSSMKRVLQGKMPKVSNEYKEYQEMKDAEQLMKSYDDSTKKYKLPKKSEVQSSTKEHQAQKPNNAPENGQAKIDYLKKFVSKDTGDKGSSNPMATFKAIARHGRKLDKDKVEGTETNKQAEEPKSDAKPEHKQLTFLTKAGRIAKKYQAQKPDDKSVDAVVNNANQNKPEDAKEKEPVLKK